MHQLADRVRETQLCIQRNISLVGLLDILQHASFCCTDLMRQCSTSKTERCNVCCVSLTCQHILAEALHILSMRHQPVHRRLGRHAQERALQILYLRVMRLIQRRLQTRVCIHRSYRAVCSQPLDDILRRLSGNSVENVRVEYLAH